MVPAADGHGYSVVEQDGKANAFGS
jgi:hypothetical protein